MSTTKEPMSTKEERRELMRNRIMRTVKTDDPTIAIERVRSLFAIEDRGIDELPEEYGPEDLVDAAKALYESESEDIQVDADAQFSPQATGCWVQGWLWVDWDELSLLPIDTDDTWVQEAAWYESD